MLSVPWNVLSGWGTPRIHPFGKVSLDPHASVLNFAQTCFEGFKAYRTPSGKVALFRPDMNMKRMQTSAGRATLPGFDGEAMLELIKQLVRLEKDWVPDKPGYSLYIRPLLIGTEGTLVVAPPSDALLTVICCPVGPYYPEGFKPIALYGTTEFIRASPGGIGSYKLGANYVTGLIAAKEAAKQGCVQNLWLQGPEHIVTEVGTMNAMAVFKHPDGTVELATAPLDGMILPGVTRDSVLTLAREHASGKSKVEGLPDKFIVSEREVRMKEVQDAAKAGTLVEFFGTGTAAVISPVNRIRYLDEDVHIPTGPDGMGPVSKSLWQRLVAIQTGAIEHPWSVAVPE
ncbi:branched-chain amino acid aminotransferase II [Fomitopsis serialis]|uniref:branched-chain amino acid aminotransferase II n=1 Tax=Fomitopsis serialis TaxID=139415 RepID=UPI002008EA28|nr:branched-chain amino acid aminotransferase II [Neoantrodia serialis]KAH9935609.1 branched-chain amino acid aminotransferase II [Neoantrodia serialis]